ncbi:MAG: Altered inheritance of mitochondria protein 6 [Icmadophila ericetorum]|nr:Altered inheritance of mitochondria protein 6 [Icmadophila ericetorum]
MEVLRKQNPITEFHPDGNTTRDGVFDTSAEQPLTLLVDFKTAGPDTWPFVIKALEPLRAHGFLTRWNGTHIVPGPIVVVGTGNTPFDHIISDEKNPHHDIFYDAPLSEMWEDREWEEVHDWPESNEGGPGEFLFEDEGSAEEDREMDDHPWGQGKHIYKPEQHKSYSQVAGEIIKATIELDTEKTNKTAILHSDIYTITNSYYASASFGSTIGRMWRYRLSPRQMSILRGQIRGAHRRGLKVRYWDLPDWPIGLRNHVWQVLVGEGVDLLNADDLKAATRWDWRRRREDPR